MMKPNLQRSWSKQGSVSPKNDVKRKKIRNFSAKQAGFRILQRTGTRSDDIIPGFLSPKSNEDLTNSTCSTVVFTSVFVATMLWSLSAMAALPLISPEKNQITYAAPAPKVTTITLHGGIFELVIACFPGEAILSRPRYEKSYYNADMKKYSNLAIAMNLVCRNGLR